MEIRHRLRPAHWPVAAMLLLLPSIAGAAPLYDMGPMLDAPHPFEVREPPQLRSPSRPRFSGRLYDMGPMLDEPHPFDLVPQPAPAPVTTVPLGPTAAPRR